MLPEHVPDLSTFSEAGDRNVNGVTPGTKETPVTDVTGNQGQAEVDLSAADEQVLREPTERAPAVDVLGVSQRLGPAAG